MKHRYFKDQIDKEIILVNDLKPIITNKLKYIYVISSWKNTKKNVELKVLDCIKKKKNVHVRSGRDC